MNKSKSRKTNLDEVDGWTPLIDEMVQSYGVVGAAVFGRIWRYCQMEDQVCRVALSRIAEDLNMEKSTVSRYVARLVKDGYLRDLTPEAGNRPHTYEDTGKANIDLFTRQKANESKSVAQKNVAQKNTDQRSEGRKGTIPASTSGNGFHQSVVLSNTSVAQKNVAEKNVFLSNESVAEKNAGVALKNAHIRNKETNKKQEETHTRAKALPSLGGAGSRFSLKQCQKFARYLQVSGQGIRSPGGYGTEIFRTGEGDEMIEEFLAKPPRPSWAEYYEKRLKSLLAVIDEDDPRRAVIREVLEQLGGADWEADDKPLRERLLEAEIEL